eukprot:NODE_3570_length_1198_cov_78.774884_g3390_i0.p1 GENE.NODE_3570_length_1198_cov_78.774884_g3390_i0~~NODE_3570_length_1198_cov_78.774884_g3390_i0.p1  ORF type:complete len:366 (+),score=80.29 NODE_3570_length_1198_cov_78.774884_g3390_i0:59-1099(+)
MSADPNPNGQHKLKAWCDLHKMDRLIEHLEEVSPGVYHCLPRMSSKCRVPGQMPGKWECSYCFYRNSAHRRRRTCKRCKMIYKGLEHMYYPNKILAKFFPPSTPLRQVMHFFQDYGELKDVSFNFTKRMLRPKSAVITFANESDVAKLLQEKVFFFGDPLVLDLAEREHTSDQQALLMKVQKEVPEEELKRAAEEAKKKIKIKARSKQGKKRCVEFAGKKVVFGDDDEAIPVSTPAQSKPSPASTTATARPSATVKDPILPKKKPTGSASAAKSTKPAAPFIKQWKPPSKTKTALAKKETESQQPTSDLHRFAAEMQAPVPTNLNAKVDSGLKKKKRKKKIKAQAS